MPLISIPAEEALEIRHSNPVCAWGDRTQSNRVEPLAKPQFEIPLLLEKGEAIFTIGSCFARNIEAELHRRGFRIPMQMLLKSPEFASLPGEIVNNFGTPSIENEFAWAFGEREFSERDCFYEIRPGKFVDLHMVPSVRPAPLERVRARRSGLLKATRQLADCRLVIMTLGLVELWWDGQAGVYLNSTPLPSILTANPDRFSLHVLDFEECYSHLRSAFDIMFKHGRPDLHVVLTVSPVPLMSTHRPIDVITANSYSKSLLRTVAEHIVERDSRVTYFPSYESVTLSDRQVAWQDDLVHVTREIVSFNVERMVNAYTGRFETNGDGGDCYASR